MLDEDYLAFRVGQVTAFGEELAAAGVPVVAPIGGHAVYVDARALRAPHPAGAVPGAGARRSPCTSRGASARSRSAGVMFGRPDPDARGKEKLPDLDLVRLAVPRRVYTNTHLDYVAEVTARLRSRAPRLSGVRIVKQAPLLRHFTARFELSESSRPPRYNFAQPP